MSKKFPPNQRSEFTNTTSENVNGKYSSNWEDVSEKRKVTVSLELPDREHVDEVCEYLNQINELLQEIDSHNSESNNSRLVRNKYVKLCCSIQQYL